MPSFVVKQPNGNYALFSTVCDAFTWLDCTEAEMIDVLCDDMGRRDAAEKFKRGAEDLELKGGPLTGLPQGPNRRWQFALRILRDNNRHALDECIKLLPDCFPKKGGA
jgi:hypothetical protein